MPQNRLLGLIDDGTLSTRDLLRMLSPDEVKRFHAAGWTNESLLDAKPEVLTHFFTTGEITAPGEVASVGETVVVTRNADGVIVASRPATVRWHEKRAPNNAIVPDWRKIGLAAAVVAAAGLFVYRRWKKRKK